jgi:hypothetical protein
LDVSRKAWRFVNQVNGSEPVRSSRD